MRFQLMLLISIFSIQVSWAQPWETLSPGLDYGRFSADKKPILGKGKISVLRIDPEAYEISIFSAGQSGEDYARTAPQWATEKNLIAVINAGMFQMDGVTNTGFMKIGSYYNNRSLSKDNCIAAFGAKSEGHPEFQIIDRTCEDWDSLKKVYHAYSQGIRMMNCQGRNVWSQQPKQWSTACLGEDEQGRVLFIFSRSPYSVHDLIDILHELPLDLVRLQYLEGGPEASLYISTPGIEVQEMGSYETGFYESDDNHHFWSIPNIIGVRAR